MFILLFFLTTIAFSQPDWVIECPKGAFTEFYFCGFAIDRNYELALSKSINNAILQISRTYSVDVEIKVDKSTKFDNTYIKIKLKGQEQYLTLRLVDKYYKKIDGDYHVWTLIAVPKPPQLARKEPTDLEAMIKSAIFPGWGQFTKGQTDHAVFFITAEGIAAGLTLYFLSIPNEKAKFYAKISLGVTAGIHILNIIDAGYIKNKIR
jgi:hypothetical protein